MAPYFPQEADELQIPTFPGYVRYVLTEGQLGIGDFQQERHREILEAMGKRKEDVLIAGTMANMDPLGIMVVADGSPGIDPQGPIVGRGDPQTVINYLQNLHGGGKLKFYN